VHDINSEDDVPARIAYATSLALFVRGYTRGNSVIDVDVVSYI